MEVAAEWQPIWMRSVNVTAGQSVSQSEMKQMRGIIFMVESVKEEQKESRSM